MGAGAAVLGERGADRRPRRAVGVVEGALEAGGLSLAEALRVHRVHVDAVDRHPHLVAELALERGSLVHRHLLGQRHDRHAGCLMLGDEAVELLRLRVHGSDPGDAGECPGRLEEADPVAGRRRVDDHQVVAARLLHLPVGLGELPDLADRHQLLQPWGGRRQVVEELRAHQQVAHRPHLQLKQQVLAQRLVGVDRDRPQVGGDLDLVEADLALLEDPRGGLLGGDLADDRPLAARGGRQSQGQGDRRLADAALSGDE